jgi:hypothetical protein
MEVPKGFVASAVRLPTSSRNRAGRREPWQVRAWEYWQTVGELRAVGAWVGNVLSRARLVPAERQGRMLVPITDKNHPASIAMDALYGGPQGQSEMLSQFGIHSTVAGEEYIVHRAEDQTWHTLATGKISDYGSQGKMKADFGEEGGQVVLTPGKDLVIRIWTPSPLDPTKADSAVRACLTTLAQINAYDAHITAQVRSRLAGNGILFMSNDVEFARPPDADPSLTSAQVFMKMLAEAMLTPIDDPADPSALVPIVAMVPTDALGKNEHLTFWSDLDNKVVEMRDAAIKRLALGLDIPPEVLLGIADASHWNAWLSEESAVKAHIEPRLGVFAYGLTEQYLQPAVKGRVPNPEDIFVIADTSSIRLRPNRSTEAIELYNAGELSGDALRRETGFQPEDKPSDDEYARYLLKRVSLGAVSPEQTAAALRMLGVDLGPIADQTPQLPPDHTRTNLVPIPTRSEIPEQPDGLAAACNVLVYRALERAGNRLRSAHPRYDASDVPTTQIYQRLTGDPDALLAGAWDCARDVLEPYAPDVEAVIETLDFYTKGVIASQRPHSQTVLGALLATRPTPIAMAPNG